MESDYLEKSDYQKWKAKFANANHVPTGDQSETSSGGTPDPLRDKRTQYGTALLSLLERARMSGALDEIDVYRLCGLKPKYQNQLFAVA